MWGWAPALISAAATVGAARTQVCLFAWWWVGGALWLACAAKLVACTGAVGLSGMVPAGLTSPRRSPSLPPAAANNTWWNIRASSGAALKLPACNFGALVNFVGSSSLPPEKGDWGVITWAAGAGNSKVGAAAKQSKPTAAAPPYTLFPGYCAQKVQWWIEQLRPEAHMYPSDLFGAMAATRQQRLRG